MIDNVEDGSGRPPAVSYFAGWLLDPDAPLPDVDSVHRQVAEAKYEQGKAERERAEREAREADHLDTLARLGQGRTVEEIFDRQLREERVEARRREHGDRERDAAAAFRDAEPTLADLRGDARREARKRVSGAQEARDAALTWARERREKLRRDRRQRRGAAS